MDSTLSRLNNLVVTEPVKFFQLKDGEYHIRIMESKTCRQGSKSWRSIRVTANNDEGKVYAFFLPSAHASVITEDDIETLKKGNIGFRKEGVALTWFQC